MTRLLAPLAVTLTLALTPAAALAATPQENPGGMESTVEGAYEGGRELMSFVWQESLWTLIVFLLFFGALSFVVWPKILGALKAREEKQRGDLLSAENAARDAEKTLAEYKQQLAEAQKQAQRIIDESRTAAQQVAAQVQADAEARAKAQAERSAAEIKAAKEQAIAEIYEQTAEIATQVASKILAREISPADQQALVSQSLQELGDLNRN